jgi:hypothetical protein
VLASSQSLTLARSLDASCDVNLLWWNLFTMTILILPLGVCCIRR